MNPTVQRVHHQQIHVLMGCLDAVTLHLLSCHGGIGTAHTNKDLVGSSLRRMHWHVLRLHPYHDRTAYTTPDSSICLQLRTAYCFRRCLTAHGYRSTEAHSCTGSDIGVQRCLVGNKVKVQKGYGSRKRKGDRLISVTFFFIPKVHKEYLEDQCAIAWYHTLVRSAVT